MTPECAYELIEGEVRADLRLMSTIRTLLIAMEEHPLVRRVRLGFSPEQAGELLDRAKTLFESPGQDGYAHPDDLALATYIYVVARILPPQAQPFINAVAAAGRREFAAATAVARYFTELTATTSVVQPCSSARSPRPRPSVGVAQSSGIVITTYRCNTVYDAPDGADAASEFKPALVGAVTSS